MTGQSSRRDFSWKVSSGVGGSYGSLRAVGKAASLGGPANETPKVGAEISIWVISGEERFAAAPRAI